MEKTSIYKGLIVAFLLGASACAAPTTPAPTATTAPTATPVSDKIISTYTLPDIPLASLQTKIKNDRKLLLGSIGSDLWHDEQDAENQFWAVTDRGPNGQIKVDGENRRTFPVPEYTPMILHVQVEGKAIKILQAIPLVGQDETPVTGLPNTDPHDETPYDFAAKEKLAFNVNGLDTEGLIRTAGGEFWLADEYGPSIVHVAADGKVLKRYIPAGQKLEGASYPVSAALPAIYGMRKNNRGFEGITLSKDGKTLYMILQSPLLNPDKKTGEASRLTRILAFDIASEKVVAEYAYQLEMAKDFDPESPNPADMKLASVAFVNATTLLVLEHTDRVAKLYLVDLSKATDLLGGKWSDPKTTPTLESLAEPKASGVEVLPKTLVIDLAKLAGMPENIEGVTILNPSTIAVANDNNFDVGEFDNKGNNQGKNIETKILVISLAQPLPWP